MEENRYGQGSGSSGASSSGSTGTGSTSGMSDNSSSIGGSGGFGSGTGGGASSGGSSSTSGLGGGSSMSDSGTTGSSGTTEGGGNFFSDLLERIGINQSTMGNLKDRVGSIDVEQSMAKARDYVKNNPEVVLGTLAALAIGAGLLASRKSGSSSDSDTYTLDRSGDTYGGTGRSYSDTKL